MKILIMALAVVFTSATQSIKAQDTTGNSQLSAMLQSYYQVKDALVAGNNNMASEGATTFIKNLVNIPGKLTGDKADPLLKDAGTIANSKSIDKQRAAFSGFSTNMAELAKSLKLTDRAIYLQYCPMKKASWLSSEKSIKNPYYGNSMLTCGKVTETIQ